MSQPDRTAFVIAFVEQQLTLNPDASVRDIARAADNAGTPIAWAEIATHRNRWVMRKVNPAFASVVLDNSIIPSKRVIEPACVRCGEKGHWISQCPKMPPAPTLDAKLAVVSEMAHAGIIGRSERAPDSEPCLPSRACCRGHICLSKSERADGRRKVPSDLPVRVRLDSGRRTPGAGSRLEEAGARLQRVDPVEPLSKWLVERGG